MIDFAALPPEVNSARMYAGAGSGPLVAAAAAWDRLAAELGSAASSYQGIVAELTDGSWVGPSSAAMAAAVAPYVAWMSGTAAQAEHTAAQVRAAVAAYEAAFAAVVPPAVVAANRASLASLVASNVLGQHTSAIAANQAQYAEMWTQDVAAMHGYAAGSAAATTLPPFTPAPAAAEGDFDHQVGGYGFNNISSSDVINSLLATFGSIPRPDFPASNPLSLVVDLMFSPLSDQLNANLAELGIALSQITGPLWSSFGIVQMLGTAFVAPLAFSPYTSLMSAHEAVGGAVGAPPTPTGSVLAGSASAPGAGASAGVGRAVSVGGLSVPQSWGAAGTEIRLTATALPAAGSAALPEIGLAGAGLGGLPLLGSAVNASGNGAPRRPDSPRSAVIAGLPGAVAGLDDTPGRTAVAVSPLSEREREELDRLREEVAHMKEKRNAATRLIREAIRS